MSENLVNFDVLIDIHMVYHWYSLVCINLAVFDTYLSNPYGYNNIQHIQQQLLPTNNNMGIVYYVENARPFHTNSYTSTYFFYKLFFLSKLNSAYNFITLFIYALNYAVSYSLIIYTLSQRHGTKIASTSDTGHTHKTPEFGVCPTDCRRSHYQGLITCK